VLAGEPFRVAGVSDGQDVGTDRLRDG
jgi:hypothetical protein